MESLTKHYSAHGDSYATTDYQFGVACAGFSRSREYRIPEEIFVYFIMMIIDHCNFVIFFISFRLMY